jgi:serine/threonine protein kinase
VLGDLLGRGGMAEVFAGHSVGDHGFQKPVAIKRLLPELANDEVFVDRLIEEAKLLVGIQHGNIVSVMDLAREGDDVFLVMEFVDGPSLRQLIKARGARGLSLGVATYVVQAAAAGLEFAHARPGGAIIHADISPSNLLLTTSGEVRVADFGIARREGLGQGVVEGKWAYMAPEQARGEALTPRSDVFALGVVLYELLTGKHPFGQAVTPSQRDEQMRVIPPRVVKPTVPAGLDAICMRALAHDPRDRYGRMQQLIDALVEERYANGYRDAASELAQAIREIAPASEAGPSRTMHTARPVTLMTRSLLREVTPPRRPSPSPLPRRPVASPAYPLGPLDPPPRDAFPLQPTVGVQTMMRLAGPPPPDQFPMVPTMAVETVARFVDAPPADEFPMLATSGTQTVAREADQAALAEAASAAAAMLQLPGFFQVEAAPIPPFRMGNAMTSAALAGDELASVVGGHTVAGHGGVAVAIEPRGQRWTLAVLAVAALIGIIAAIAIQLPRGHRLAPVDPAQAQPALTGTPDDKPAGPPPSQPEPQAEPTAAPPVPPPPVQPTIMDPPAPTLASQEAAPVPPAPTPTQPDPAPVPVAPTPTAAPVAPTPTAAPVAPSEPGAGAARPSARRLPPTRDAGARKEPGILSVQSVPWSWVSINGVKKETPDKFSLAPGEYVVRFYNPENGLTKYERVTIESGKRFKLNEAMDQ